MHLRKIIFFFQLVFFSPIILLIIAISPFVKLRIGALKTDCFGSLALASEMFLCEKKNNTFKNEYFLWYTRYGPSKNHPSYISNFFLFKDRKKQMFFLPGFILHPIHAFFSKHKLFHKFIYFEVQNGNLNIEKLSDEKNLLSKFPSFVKFSNSETKNGEKFLRENNISPNDKIVCFASRDSSYKKEKISSLRNSSIYNQIEAIKYLNLNGYKAIRLGKNTKHKLNQNKNILDISSFNIKNDYIYLFIPSKCEFMITGDTGAMEAASIMRKPKLLVDFLQFNNISYFNENFHPIMLPKKIFCNRTNKFLSYREIFEKKIYNFQTEEQLPDELEVLNNDKLEILEATKEMLKVLNTKNFNFEIEKAKQKKFWDLIHYYFKVTNKKSIISPSFFQKNIELFK